MYEPDQRPLAHPLAFWLWIAFIGAIGLAVVLLPIFAVP